MRIKGRTKGGKEDEDEREDEREGSMVFTPFQEFGGRVV
jgi:hypothetical protein